MTKEKYHLDLAIKYFIQQKVEEIISVLWIPFLIVFIPYILGTYACNFKLVKLTGTICPAVSLIQIWGLGLFMLMNIILILLVVLIILMLFFLTFGGWFLSNWKKAKQRARINI